MPWNNDVCEQCALYRCRHQPPAAYGPHTPSRTLRQAVFRKASFDVSFNPISKQEVLGKSYRVSMHGVPIISSDYDPLIRKVS